jgi:hypothetical protein
MIRLEPRDVALDVLEGDEQSLNRLLIPFVPAEAGTQNLDTFECITR